MPDPDDIPDRLTAVEADAKAARLLAAGADRDVSEVRAELRAHTRAISALHDDHVELRGEFIGFRAEMYAFRAEMYAFRDETRQGFATVNAGMAQIVELLGQISDP